MAPEPSDQPPLKEPSELTTRGCVLTDSKPKKNGKPKDPRRSHAALQFVKDAIGYMPKKLYWDDIIAMADPDQSGRNRLQPEKCKDLVKIALSVGIYEGNLAVWLFDWYINGVPTHHYNRPITHQLASKYGRRNQTQAYAVNQSGINPNPGAPRKKLFKERPHD